MFLFVVISKVVKDYNWTNILHSIHSLLPYHKTLQINDRGEEVPLKYTIKRNAKGVEMIAASTIFHGIKSRFIYDGTKKMGCVDFPQRNIRAWILKKGDLVLRPIFKEKEYNPSLVKGFSKLAMLHIEKYLKVFDMELRD